MPSTYLQSMKTEGVVFSWQSNPQVCPNEDFQFNGGWAWGHCFSPRARWNLLHCSNSVFPLLNNWKLIVPKEDMDKNSAQELSFKCLTGFWLHLIQNPAQSALKDVFPRNDNFWIVELNFKPFCVMKSSVQELSFEFLVGSKLCLVCEMRLICSQQCVVSCDMLCCN